MPRSLVTQSPQATPKEIRRSFRQQRNALTIQQQTSAGIELVKQIQQTHVCSSAKNLAIYTAFDGEIDTYPLIEFLWSSNKNVYLPVLHPFSKGYLLFLRYTPTTPMIKNKFGIAEPKLDLTQICLLQDLDIIFTPLVAFDEAGNRLGMGGGFYDRTLESIHKKHAVVDSANDKTSNPQTPNNTRLIGLAHDIQKTLSLPCQSWDIPLEKIITPNQLYSFERN